jgi:hypothetical protein
VLLRFLLSESNHHREQKQQFVEICLIFIVVIRIIILDIGSTQLLGKEKSPSKAQQSRKTTARTFPQENFSW